MYLIDLIKAKVGYRTGIVRPVQLTDTNTGKPRFMKEWICACGATLRIFADKDRGEGPSNFEGVHTAKSVEKYNIHPRYIGHSIVSSGLLNWAGLAEERGWKVEPLVECPACQKNMTVNEFKEARRKGVI